MLLVIDIGNTNIVLGVFEGGETNGNWRATTRKDRTGQEDAVLCRNLFTLKRVSVEKIVGAVNRGQ